jgi:GNAT superfamily N-acetyltransferase
MAYEYHIYDQTGLDLIEPLWQKLNQHHAEQGSAFAAAYAANTFAQRKQELLAKAAMGQFRLVIAWDKASGQAIAYCASSAIPQGLGEVESLYLEPSERSQGMGKHLVKDALQWMDGLGVKKRKVVVYSGNEEAVGFYEKMGFKTRYLVMEGVG